MTFRRTFSYVLVIVIAMVAPQVAGARGFSSKTLSDSHVGKSKTELGAQIHYSSFVVKHYQNPHFRWRVAPRHKTCWSNVPWAKICDKSRKQVIAHRRLLAIAKARYEKLYAPKPTYVGISSNSLYDAFMCIHKYEGAWNANTGNRYYGGLQMDYGFMSKYGGDYLRRWGTADNWPPAAQIEVAIRAYHSGRGFGPWPNTRLSCGL